MLESLNFVLRTNIFALETSKNVVVSSHYEMHAP